MRVRGVDIIAAALWGGWWIVDRTLGDKLFAWLRPVMPAWLVDPSLGDLIAFGPLLVLLLAWGTARLLGDAHQTAALPSAPEKQEAALGGPQRDVSLSAAAAYIVSGKWEPTPFGGPDWERYLQIAPDLSQHARDGSLRIWGRNRSHGETSPYVLIEANDWQTLEIQPLELYYQMNERVGARPRRNASGAYWFVDLWTSKDQIERLYPHA